MSVGGGCFEAESRGSKLCAVPWLWCGVRMSSYWAVSAALSVLIPSHLNAGDCKLLKLRHMRQLLARTMLGVYTHSPTQSHHTHTHSHALSLSVLLPSSLQALGSPSTYLER